MASSLLNFSLQLQQALTYIADVSVFSSKAIILRDHNTLPKSAGFDIDILIGKEEFASFLQTIKTYFADKNQFICQVKNKRYGAKIAIINCHEILPNERNWVLLDIQFFISIGRFKIARDMLTTSKDYNAKRYVLDKEWINFLIFIQDIRKSRKTMFSSNDLEVFFRSYPEISAAVGYVGEDIDLFVKKVGLHPYLKQKRKTTSLTWKYKLQSYLFFIHKYKPFFVCVSGPDGVGKTTLINNIVGLLKCFPFLLNSYHHTTYVKSINQQKDNALVHRPLYWRFIKTILPEKLLQYLRVILAEIRYAIALNQAIIKSYAQDKLLLLDRYVLDRYLKMQTHKKSKFQTFMTYLLTYLMRKPSVLIIPKDTPRNIRKRKQELSEKEIERYYHDASRYWRKRRINAYEIDVQKFSQQELAVEALKLIFRSMEENLVDFLQAGKEEYINKK